MAGPNRSSAVMQQRSEPHDSLDDFPTPPWATRALCEFLLRKEPQARWLSEMTCREPAANRGHMVKPLSEYFLVVKGSDVHDYGAGFEQKDYLFGPPDSMDDFTITNPPFRLAEQFIDRAIETSSVGVAMLVRTSFLEGVGRYSRLFSCRWPQHVLQFSERVVMHKGKLSAKGSTATSYSWLFWSIADLSARPQLHWIPPCRRRLERPEDYP